MKKTIFSRYLRITMSIVAFSFVVLGSVMIAFFSRYWENDQRNVLMKNARSVSSVAERILPLAGEDNHMMELVWMVLDSYAQTAEADLFITDPEGEILGGSAYSSSLSMSDAQINQNVMRVVMSTGDYEACNDLYGFYENDFFIVGIPLVTLLPDGVETRIGAVFATKSASPFNAFQQESIQIFLVAAALTLALSFMIIGFFAYNLVRPLHEMSVAVNRFAAGEFSVRVPVNSEDEIGQLASSFNNMANSLSSGEEMRRSFVANVSHELKTPMTTIAGFVDGILDDTIPKSQQKKYLYVVSEEIKRLSRLVKSMLDLSRIDSGEMNIHPQQFDLTQMIVTILLTFERSVEEKRLEIRGLEDAGRITVYGDQDLLYQVVYNLIENAVKFTNLDGYIEFIVTESIDRISVAIQNSGEGIRAEELPMIFDRFYKIDRSRSKDRKGMGLGLYIVRTIIKLHGGEINVSSEQNQYTRFEFSIPKREGGDSFTRERDSKEFTVYDAEILDDVPADGKVVEGVIVDPEPKEDSEK